MCMPTNAAATGLGYAWGFAPAQELVGKAELDAQDGLHYTLGNAFTGAETTLTTVTSASNKSPNSQEKIVKVVGTRKAMFVVNDAFHGPSHRPPQQAHPIQVPGKHFMTPLGPIQLTAEECNEILMKRAIQAAQGTTASVIDASQLLNGNVKGVDGGGGATNDNQQLAQVQLIQTKQEPGTHVSSKSRGNTLGKERPYACEECGKSFLLKHHLTTHSRVHTGERPHACPHCGKAFAHKHCLNTHLLLHSSDRPFQCQECKKSFTLKHHLLTHSRVHSRERPFVCTECGRGFPLKRHLVTHSKFHAGERPFICPECGESFAQKDHLVMHSRFHGSLNPFVCPDCGAAFPRKFQLVNHGRLHGRVPHSCPICGKEFLQKRTLVAHLKLHTGDSTFACIECGEAFKGRADMLQHCRVMHPASSHNPSPSQTTISQQSSTSSHNSHHELKPQLVQVLHPPHGARQKSVQIITSESIDTKAPGHSCQECGNSFNSREALALHVRLHTGDRTFVNDLCALTAALQTGNLFPGQQQGTGVLHHGNQSVHQTNNHITAHHITPHHNRPKVHFCGDCGKGFAARHGLQQHNRRHPDGSCTLRTHVCDTCGKAFFQKNHLLLHQRQHMDLPPRNQQQQQTQSQSTDQQNGQLIGDSSQPAENAANQNPSNTMQIAGPTHVQVTNREGQVIGNQIIMTGSRSQQLMGNQIHILSRDRKTIGTQINNMPHNIKQEIVQNNRDSQASMSSQQQQQQQQQQINAAHQQQQQQQSRDNSQHQQLTSAVHHQSVHPDQQQQQQQQQQMVTLQQQHKDHMATTSTGHLVLRSNPRDVGAGGQQQQQQPQLAQLSQVHLGSHVIKYEIIPQQSVVAQQVQSLE